MLTERISHRILSGPRHVWPRPPTFLLSLAGLLLLTAQTMAQYSRDLTVEQMASEERIALVIGNGAYSAAPLKNPVNDAKAMAEVLRSCGFTVIEGIDEDRRGMYEAIRLFGRKIRAGGVGLFYYAGHGMQINGRNYLIPVGADILEEAEVEFESVDAYLVLEKMEAAGNRVNIVILDACRDNPFSRRFRSSTRGLAQLEAAHGSILEYATGPGQVATDGDGRNGLYTEMILRHIRQPGLKIEDVFKSVRRDVMLESGGDQVPWEASSLTGDFYFNLPTPEDAPSPGSIEHTAGLHGEATQPLESALVTPQSPSGATHLPPAPSDPQAVAGRAGMSLFYSAGAFLPEGTELGRVFSDDADARLLVEPAPLLQVSLSREVPGTEFRHLHLSLLLGWPKSQPTPSDFGGHKGFISALILGADRPLHHPKLPAGSYLTAGAGLWFLKFSRTRFSESLDLNPAFRLGMGTSLRGLGDGQLDIEAGYLPLKGPTYVVNSFYLFLRYHRS